MLNYYQNVRGCIFHKLQLKFTHTKLTCHVKFVHMITSRLLYCLNNTIEFFFDYDFDM